MIPTLKSIFNFNQWKQVQQWVNNKLTLKQDIFNANNTATSATSVTINAKSGVATFSGIILGNLYSTFTINNNLVTASSIVSLHLKYNYSGDGLPALMAYNTSSNVISVYVQNISPDQTTEQIEVAFQILN